MGSFCKHTFFLCVHRSFSVSVHYHWHTLNDSLSLISHPKWCSFAHSDLSHSSSLPKWWISIAKPSYTHRTYITYICCIYTYIRTMDGPENERMNEWKNGKRYQKMHNGTQYSIMCVCWCVEHFIECIFVWVQHATVFVSTSHTYISFLVCMRKTQDSMNRLCYGPFDSLDFRFWVRSLIPIHC